MTLAHKMHERKSRRILAVSFSMFLLAGCAEETRTTADQPWAIEIEAAEKRATSQFEKDALSDGIVTAAEKDEAHQRWVTCMTDRGHEATIELDDAGKEVYVTEASAENTEQTDTGTTLCADGTTKIIPGLYEAMQQNPNNRDFNELYAECLVRHGLVEPPFTGKDFADAMADSKSGVKGTPWNFEDPVFRRCLSFPGQ